MHPDKMLYFQGLYGFRRNYLPFLNFPKTIENTRQTGFSGFTNDSSQTVVTYALRCLEGIAPKYSMGNFPQKAHEPACPVPVRVLC